MGGGRLPWRRVTLQVRIARRGDGGAGAARGTRTAVANRHGPRPAGRGSPDMTVGYHNAPFWPFPHTLDGVGGSSRLAAHVPAVVGCMEVGPVTVPVAGWSHGESSVEAEGPPLPIRALVARLTGLLLEPLTSYNAQTRVALPTFSLIQRTVAAPPSSADQRRQTGRVRSLVYLSFNQGVPLGGEPAHLSEASTGPQRRRQIKSHSWGPIRDRLGAPSGSDAPQGVR